MDNLKIKKGESYTYEQIKKIYKNAVLETINKPMGEIKDKELKGKAEDPHLQLSMMLSGMLILQTMENNLFEKENNLHLLQNEKEEKINE